MSLRVNTVLCYFLSKFIFFRLTNAMECLYQLYTHNRSTPQYAFPPSLRTLKCNVLEHKFATTILQNKTKKQKNKNDKKNTSGCTKITSSHPHKQEPLSIRVEDIWEVPYQPQQTSNCNSLTTTFLSTKVTQSRLRLCY
jgi:hypothetical protein